MTLKILVAEDSLTQATLMKLALQRIGYEVVLARDGIEAIKKAWQERPDLVVSDVVMPRLNGREAWERIRARRRFMEDALGIALHPDVLPFSNIPAWLPPFLLRPDRAMVMRG